MRRIDQRWSNLPADIRRWAWLVFEGTLIRDTCLLEGMSAGVKVKTEARTLEASRNIYQ